MYVVMVTFVEIEVDVFIEDWVGYIEVEVAIYVETYLEGWFAVCFQNYCVLRHADLLNCESWKKTSFLLVLEAVVSETDIDRRAVDELEVPLTFKYAELLVIVLDSEIKWNNIGLIFDTKLLKYEIIILKVECLI